MHSPAFAITDKPTQAVAFTHGIARKSAPVLLCKPNARAWLPAGTQTHCHASLYPRMCTPLAGVLHVACSMCVCPCMCISLAGLVASNAKALTNLSVTTVDPYLDDHSDRTWNVQELRVTSDDEWGAVRLHDLCKLPKSTHACVQVTGRAYMSIHTNEQVMSHRPCTPLYL